MQCTDNFDDPKSVSSNFDASNSYVTLKSPDYTQDLNQEQSISSFLNEQIEKIEGQDSFNNATHGNLFSGDPKTMNLNGDCIPVSQINENTHIEIISPPFDIPRGISMQGKFRNS